MAIQPRCHLTGSATSSTITPALTGWTNQGAGPAGTAPVAGDLVFFVCTTNNSSATISQTGGTGTWTFRSSGDVTGGASGQVSVVAWRLFTGIETAPTFTVVTGTRVAWVMTAFAPGTPGALLSIDTSNLKSDATASTTHTASALTTGVAAAVTETSVLLFSAGASAAGTTAMTFAISTWTSAANSSNASTGTAYSASMAWRASVSGTVTPTAATIEGGSSSTGTTQANNYHYLIAEQLPLLPQQLRRLAVGSPRAPQLAVYR